MGSICFFAASLFFPNLLREALANDARNDSGDFWNPEACIEQLYRLLFLGNGAAKALVVHNISPDMAPIEPPPKKFHLIYHMMGLCCNC